MSLDGSRRLLGRAALAVLAFSVLDAGPRLARAEGAPEVIRVRAPEARVSALFPPGTPLRTLAPAEFEALVVAARAGAGRRAARADRPARVAHFARPDGPVLVGRSVVPLPATEAEPAIVACDPWSPALADSADLAEYARVEPSGRLVLVQPPHRPSRVVELRWAEAALPGSAGRAFAPRLPEAGVATCTLDLPGGVRPTINGTAKFGRGPEPGPEGTVRWEIAGAGGRCPISLDAPGTPAPGGSPASPRLWVGGPTRLDLAAPGPNWLADWTVERPDGAAATLAVDLDAGLDLVEVAGPDVASYRAAPAMAAGRPTRVEVRLRGEDSNRSRLSSVAIRGLVVPPSEGSWPVPSARPVAATWMGGRTEVRVDSARAVLAVEPKAGRRVAPRADEAPGPSAYFFEPDQNSGPLAEIRFGRPAADASASIRGTLRVGASAPRLEVAATWKVDRGLLFDPALDLPAGWAVDRVVGIPGGAPVRWRVESPAGPDRTGRLHLEGSPWAGDSAGGEVGVIVAASRIEAAPSGGDAVAAPRIRPGSGAARVVDERWEVVAEPGWAVEPGPVRGVAWLDPARLDPPRSPGDAAATGDATAGRSLAWRWAAADASATFVRRPDRPRPRLDERVEADLAGGRLRLTWSWTVAEAGRPAVLPFAIDLPPAAEPRWRVVGPGGGRAILPEGAAAGGALKLDALPRGPVTIRGEVDLPWTGTGPIPLARFAGRVETRRSLVVRVADATRFRVDRADGLTPAGLEGAADRAAPGLEVEPAPIRAIVGEGPPGLRVAGAWLVGRDSPRLEVTTVAGAIPARPSAVVAEASLRSKLAPGVAGRHRLSLRVATGTARTLDLTWPAGLHLDRVRRDGQPVAPLSEGGRLRVDLAGPAEAVRPTTSITLDYRTAADPAGIVRFHPAAYLPALAVPCLSFAWQVNLPGHLEAVGASPDLVASDAIALARAAGPAEGSDSPATMRDLETSPAAPAGGTTLGEWLVRLDSGRRPLIVDRLALGNVGWGPRTMVEAAGPDRDRPTSIADAFHSLGLTIEPVGGVFLVSTEADGQADPGRAELTADARAGFGAILAAAAAAGSDASDRYQTPARWRGEATPRSWLASETPDRGLITEGWRAHRFVAANWPAPSAAIAIRDAGPPWRRIAMLGLGLAAAVTLLGPGGMLARRHRLGRQAAGGALLAACVATCPAADLEPGGPILAILPYAHLDDVDGPPARVVLAQADHDRLARLPRPEPLQIGETTRLIAATHRVGKPEGRSVAVVSRYLLEVGDPGAGSWAVPVGTAFDLTAAVDDRSVAPAIGPDGRTATVGGLPAGRSEVTFRRLVPYRPTAEGGGAAEVAVDRCAFARVEVDSAVGSGPARLEGAAGRVVAGEGGLAGELGPRDRFSVCWGPGRPTGGDDEAEVDATIRWDARPAGDRVEARLTVVGRRPLRSLRLDLEPGLAVVAASIPGLVGAAVEPGRTGRECWAAAVDPPLEPGARFDLTLWRGVPGGVLRRPAPSWNIVGARLAGPLGFRRPADWSGRLVTPPGESATAEAEFLQAWGPVPADGLVLAGAARRGGRDRLHAEVGPATAGLITRTEVKIEVEPGRLGFVAESSLTADAGAAWDAEARFDAPVRVDRVEAAGLVAWSQPAPDRVRLTFDGSRPSEQRQVRIHGAAAAAVGLPEGDGPARPLAGRVPWPRWVGARPGPGLLVVAGGEGLVVRSAERVLAAGEGDLPPVPGGGRRSYPVRADDLPLRIGWFDPPPRVDVAVTSDLRLDPAQVTWTARVVASPCGGPIRSLHWQLPSAWAEGATLSAADGETIPRLRSDARNGLTLWTIEADRPTWGRWELTLRSTRAIRPGAILEYPQLAPLATPGRGVVTGYDLTLTNLSGRVATPEGEEGLAPLTSLRARSELSELPGGIVSRAYRVAGEVWSLRARLGISGAGAAAGDLGETGRFDDSRRLTRPGRVDYQVAVDSSGRSVGRADCAVEAGGAFLGVRLPADVGLGLVLVDGRPVDPVEAEREWWLIPLGDRGSRRVELAWAGGPPAGPIPATPDRPIGLPRFDRPAVSASLRVATTGVGDVVVAGGRWARLDPAAAALARAGRARGRVEALVRGAQPDPTPADLVATTEALVALALEARPAERSLRDGRTASQAPLAAWRAIQTQAEAAASAGGLGEAVDRARVLAGLVPPGPAGEPGAEDETADPYRIRPIGRVVDFDGSTPDDPSTPLELLIRP